MFSSSRNHLLSYAYQVFTDPALLACHAQTPLFVANVTAFIFKWQNPEHILAGVSLHHNVSFSTRTILGQRMRVRERETNKNMFYCRTLDRHRWNGSVRATFFPSVSTAASYCRTDLVTTLYSKVPQLLACGLNLARQQYYLDPQSPTN